MRDTITIREMSSEAPKDEPNGQIVEKQPLMGGEAVEGQGNTNGGGRRKPRKEKFPMTSWTYDLFLWVISMCLDLFFREVHPRGSWKIPRRGPVIFVAAPHANQVCGLYRSTQSQIY